MTASDNARAVCVHMIGDNRLCMVKVFVAEEYKGENIVTDVTGPVARLIGRKRNDGGWIVGINAGYDPRLYISELYDELMKREPKDYWAL